MEIIEDNGKYLLEWRYAVKVNTKTVEGEEYFSYVTTFPLALSTWLGAEWVYLYLDEGRIYLTTEEPAYPSRRQKLISKGNTPQRNISLSKKMFHMNGYVHGVVLFRLHIDVIDPTTSRRGLVELDLELD